MALLLEYKRHGIACILIARKLNEIAQFADTITTLRDGTTVETLDCREEPVGEDRIIKGMVGREMADRYPKRVPAIGETIFEVKDWRGGHHFHARRPGGQGLQLRLRPGGGLCISPL